MVLVYLENYLDECIEVFEEIIKEIETPRENDYRLAKKK